MRKLKHFFGFMYNYMFFVEYRINFKIKFLLACKRKSRFKIYVHFATFSLLKKYNVIIAFNSTIGHNLKLPHPHNVVIGDRTQIGDNCTIYHDVTLGQSKGEFPIIGNNVIVYAGARIIGNVKVGDNAVIGANAVVTHDISPNAIVGGIPAKVIRYRSEEDVFY